MGRELERGPEGVTAEFVSSRVLQSGGGGVALARPRREPIGREPDRGGAVRRSNFPEVTVVTAGAGEAAASREAGVSHCRRSAGLKRAERAEAFGGARSPSAGRCPAKFRLPLLAGIFLLRSQP